MEKLNNINIITGQVNKVDFKEGKFSLMVYEYHGHHKIGLSLSWIKQHKLSEL